MKLLHSIVIPKILSEWKTVVDFLELNLSLIKIIQERCDNDPSTCCGEMLREWLMIDSGLQLKMWSTLINFENNLKTGNQVLIPLPMMTVTQQLSAVGNDHHKSMFALSITCKLCFM